MLEFCTKQPKDLSGSPLTIHKEACYHAEGFLTYNRPILAPQTLARKPVLRRVVIDAGQGGRDFGAQNTSQSLREKDLTLDVAFRLKRILEADGFQVFLTR